MLDRTRHYHAVAIAFHWTIAAAVIANLAIGLLHDAIPALRAAMPAHKALGIAVLVLTAARIAWRLVHRPPPLPASVGRLEKGAAHAVHWVLYILLILLPLSGWVMVSDPARARPLSFFGLFDVPLLPVSSDAAAGAHSGHGLLGWVMLALVVIHIAAALRHHFVLRDSVLSRMAPALDRGD